MKKNSTKTKRDKNLRKKIDRRRENREVFLEQVLLIRERFSYNFPPGNLPCSNNAYFENIPHRLRLPNPKQDNNNNQPNPNAKIKKKHSLNKSVVDIAVVVVAGFCDFFLFGHQGRGTLSISVSVWFRFVSFLTSFFSYMHIVLVSYTYIG